MNPGQGADADFLRVKKFSQSRFKIPAVPRAAGENVQAEGLVLGKCVASQMRFRKKRQPSDTAGVWKLMPVDIADEVQIEIGNQTGEQRGQDSEVTQLFG